MVGMLRAHRAAQTVASIDGFVFTRTDGRPWPRTTLADAWHRAADKLAADGAPLPVGANGWHALRHSLASRLVEAGIPPAEVAEQLGHTVDMLLSTYSHVVDRTAADSRLRASLDV
jgi:integrase